MRVRLARSILAALFLVTFASAVAFAQGSFFTSLSGVVVDASGGVIPGVTSRSRIWGPVLKPPRCPAATADSPSLAHGRHLLRHRVADGLQDRGSQFGDPAGRRTGERQGDALGRRR